MVHYMSQGDTPKTTAASVGAAAVKNLLPLNDSTVDGRQQPTLTLHCQQRKQHGSVNDTMCR